MTLVWEILNSGWTWPLVEIYYDAWNHIQYVCDCQVRWTALTASKWKIKRITSDASWNVLRVQTAGDGEYSQVATSLAVVEALSYA